MARLRRAVPADPAVTRGLGPYHEDVRGPVTERMRKSRISAKRLLAAARAAGYAGLPRYFRRQARDGEV
jgi:hypothetical protein